MARGGGLAAGIGVLVVGVVILFVGLFMVAEVADVTAINSDSDFYGTYTSSVTTTGTIFSIVGIVLIVAGLAMAIRLLMGGLT